MRRVAFYRMTITLVRNVASCHQLKDRDIQSVYFHKLIRIRFSVSRTEKFLVFSLCVCVIFLNIFSVFKDFLKKWNCGRGLLYRFCFQANNYDLFLQRKSKVMAQLCEKDFG